MGKDRTGRYHPKKGKPSDATNEGLGLDPNMPASALDKDLEMTNKYTEDADIVSSGVRMRHPNRNPSKQENFIIQNGNKVVDNTRNNNQSSTANNSTMQADELPGVLYKSLFEQLATYQGDCCITAYIGTHRAGMQVNEQQDRKVFKNTLQDIRKQMQEKGMSPTQIDKMLEPGLQMLNGNDELWYNLTDGMALFIAEDYFKYVRLPFAPNNEILVNNSFYVSPLIQALAGNEHFYILQVSKNNCALYRADAFYIEKLDIDELPQGMNDVIHFEETDGTDVLDAGRPDEKDNLAQYMKEIDRTLKQTVLARENAPLVLAGVDYLLPIYRSVSTYQNIWEENLTGAYEHESPEAMYEKARMIMQPYFDKQHKHAFDNYMNKLATPLTTSMPDAVIRASFYGQVADLFIEKGCHIWGHFDADANQLDMHANHEMNDDCLVDKAAMQTILHGGRVHMLNKEEMPNGSSIAALLRYQM